MVDLNYRLDDIVEGDSWTKTLVFEDSNGNAIDITNWTLWFTVKENQSDADADAVFDKQITTHTDPTNGKTEVSLTASETLNKSGLYYYDFQIKDGSGNVETILRGKVGFTEGVSDST